MLVPACLAGDSPGTLYIGLHTGTALTSCIALTASRTSSHDLIKRMSYRVYCAGVLT